MRSTAYKVIGISFVATVVLSGLWLIGLIGGIGGAMIHLLIIPVPLTIIGVVIGIILLIISSAEGKR
jgi:hypothetical protein